MWNLKSGANVSNMNGVNMETTVVEITTGDSTLFRTSNLKIAKAFLGAIGSTEIRMVSPKNTVQTGADIALLILERELTLQPIVTKEILRNVA